MVTTICKVRYHIGTRPAHVPDGWTIYNAPRPLWGSLVPTSEGPRAKLGIADFVSGVHYAAVDPHDDHAAQWDKNNKDDDARVLIFITEAQAIDAALRWYRASKYASEIAALDLDDPQYHDWLVERGWELLNEGKIALETRDPKEIKARHLAENLLDGGGDTWPAEDIYEFLEADGWQWDEAAQHWNEDGDAA